MFKAKSLLTGFLMVLVLFLVSGIGSGEAGSPPESTYVDFPKEINADGTPVRGTVGFRASNGDLLKAIFAVAAADDFQAFEVDLSPFQGQEEGEFSFEISTTTPQKVMLSLTLLDQEGNASPSVFLTFEAIEACQSWSRIFGGSESDWGYSVQQTSDGGYILLGTTWSYGAGDYDFWLIKTDATGSKEWERTFGGSEDDWGYSVQQTSDGGYVLFGGTWSCGTGDGDFWLIKTDAQGNKEWDRTFGGSDIDWGWSIQQTSDGGYILLGYTESYDTGDGDFWLIKIDVQGNKEWERAFGGSEDEQGYSVQQIKDAGYILLGHTYSYGAGKADVWLIKTDAQGNKQWEKTFGGTEDDWGLSVQQTADGGYILLGDTCSYGARKAGVWLIKTDSQGNKQWERTFGESSRDKGWSVQQTTNGGYILLGYTYSYGAGKADVWLIKTDAQGNKEWDRTFGGSETDWGTSVQQTEDGGYILLGCTASYGAGGLDFWLIKYCPEE